MYIKRTIEESIIAASQQFPVLMVVGSRQVGKTTLLRHLARRDRRYVTLDDPTLVALAKSEPQLFLDRFEPPVLIDEIQYAPELLPYIKMRVDEHQRKGDYWLTGSQPFQLMKGVSESLAGRVGLVHLMGLSQLEIEKQTNLDQPFLQKDFMILAQQKATDSLMQIYQKIWRGSFPAIALHDEVDRDLFYSSYMQTYLQRDLRDLAQVGDAQSFLRFLRVTAARTGQLLNYADLARDADISPNTAKHWISILQTSGIVYLLQPYHHNVTKRLVKTPKLYFLDTGLCGYLTQWSSPETLEAGAISGAILETYVVGELLKSYLHHGLTPAFYYYRDKDKREIDLLIEQDQTFYPIEIKKSASPNIAAVKHFKALERLPIHVGKGHLICFAAEAMPLTATIDVVPISII